CNLTLSTVNRQVDHAHAALADAPQHPVGPELLGAPIPLSHDRTSLREVLAGLRRAAIHAAFPPPSPGVPSSRLIARRENSVAALRKLGRLRRRPDLGPATPALEHRQGARFR